MCFLYYRSKFSFGCLLIQVWAQLYIFQKCRPNTVNCCCPWGSTLRHNEILYNRPFLSIDLQPHTRNHPRKWTLNAQQPCSSIINVEDCSTKAVSKVSNRRAKGRSVLGQMKQAAKDCNWSISTDIITPTGSISFITNTLVNIQLQRVSWSYREQICNFINFLRSLIQFTVHCLLALVMEL